MSSRNEMIIKELRSRKGKWKEIARQCGMSVRTVRKIANGEIANPGSISMDTLAEYLGIASIKTNQVNQ